jgi:hypothetical protein
MTLIENLEFGNGAPTIMQYIPTVDEVSTPAPGSSPLDFLQEKNSDAIEMDFSTPIQDVMPSAAFDSDDSTPGLNGPYKSPTNDRVVGLSAGVIQAESKKGAAGIPFGLTRDQFQALVAGLAAVVAFSKPVQTKLADVVPKFLGEHGDLSLTGMLVSALIAAAIFFFAGRILENQS